MEIKQLGTGEGKIARIQKAGGLGSMTSKDPCWERWSRKQECWQGLLASAVCWLRLRESHSPVRLMLRCRAVSVLIVVTEIRNGAPNHLLTLYIRVQRP